MRCSRLDDASSVGQHSPPSCSRVRGPARSSVSVSVGLWAVSNAERSASPSADRACQAYPRALPEVDPASEPMGKFGSILGRLRQDFEVGIYNLNYDTVAASTWPEAFLGFDEAGCFRAGSMHQRRDWGFIYHLHGSVHHSLSGPFGDRIEWRGDCPGLLKTAIKLAPPMSVRREVVSKDDADRRRLQAGSFVGRAIPLISCGAGSPCARSRRDFDWWVRLWRCARNRALRNRFTGKSSGTRLAADYGS